MTPTQIHGDEIVTVPPEFPNAATVHQMRYPERVIAAIKVDRYMLNLVKEHRDSPSWNSFWLLALEEAALYRYYLTDDENSCVGYIHEGHLLLWANTIEKGKQEAARQYVASEQGALEL